MRSAIGRLLDRKSTTRGSIYATYEPRGLAPTLTGFRLLQKMFVDRGPILGHVLSPKSQKCPTDPEHPINVGIDHLAMDVFLIPDVIE